MISFIISCRISLILQDFTVLLFSAIKKPTLNLRVQRNDTMAHRWDKKESSWNGYRLWNHTIWFQSWSSIYNRYYNCFNYMHNHSQNTPCMCVHPLFFLFKNLLRRISLQDIYYLWIGICHNDLCLQSFRTLYYHSSGTGNHHSSPYIPFYDFSCSKWE